MKRWILPLSLLLALPSFGGCATSLGYALGAAAERTKQVERRVPVSSVDALLAGDRVSVEPCDGTAYSAFYYSYVDGRTREMVGYREGKEVRVAVANIRTMQVHRRMEARTGTQAKWLGAGFGAVVDGLVLLALVGDPDLSGDWSNFRLDM